MTDYNEFPLIDDERTPAVIKPMTILHDKLVKGFNNEKELRVDKLITNFQKSIGKQVIALVDLEDDHRNNIVMLLNSLNFLRKLVDSNELSKNMVSETITFINDQCKNLSSTIDIDLDGLDTMVVASQ